MDAMMCKMCKHGSMTLANFDDRFGFPCQECHEMGYGSCYKCANGCDYQLHEECHTASDVAFYSFFGYQPFYLQCQHQLPNNTPLNLCAACGTAVTGLMYASTFEPGVTVVLHPVCMKLPDKIDINDDGGDMDKFTIKRELRCLRCQYCHRTTLDGPIGPIDGWAYVSADQKTACHVKCMKKRLYDAWVAYNSEGQPRGVSHDEWLQNNYDYGLEPCVDSSSSNSVALTRSKRSGGKRLIFWKLTKVSIKILLNIAINVAIADPVGVFGAVEDLF